MKLFKWLGWLGLMASVFSAEAQTPTSMDSLNFIIKNSTDEQEKAIAMTTLGDRIFFSYPDSALRLFDQSDIIFQKILSSKTASEETKKKLYYYLAANYSDKGSIYVQKGDIQEALEYYNKAIILNEQYKNEYGVASNLNNIGYIYQSDLEDLSKALEYYNKVLAIALKLGNKFRWLVGNTYANISEVYRISGNLNLASEFIEKSDRISSEENNILGRANVSSIRAKIFKDIGNVPKAIREIRSSSNLYLKAGDQEGYASNLVILGELYSSQNQKNLAEESWTKALAEARKNNYRKIIRDASNFLQRLYFNEKRWEAYAAMAELNAQMRDSLENRNMQAKAIRNLIEIENKNEALKDSIRFMNEQLEKDRQIQKQELLIKSQKTIRNTTLVGALILIISGLIFFFRYRLIQRQRENKMQISALETEQKLLRAQMNPHFINNSLNSIQSLILENEPIEAGEYLATFSRLTRAIMDQTDKKSIPLSKEIETLKMYIEMEELRFENKFSFEIVMPHDFNPENIHIPPLLIQPFVENSILHGILHKNDKGEIIIAFEKNNATLFCSITDNGVGRDKARKINNNKLRQGDSMATELAKNRLKLLNRNPKRAIVIKDLKDELGQATGTKVILNIPLINKDPE